MHVAVIGAGIIGVTSAYALRQQGFNVTVIERRPGAAQEASFATAGVMSVGHAVPLIEPGARTAALRRLFSSEAPLRWHLRLDPAQWNWTARWLWQSRSKSFQRNAERLERLGHYSQECMRLIAQRHSIDYEHSQGVLLLYRTAAELRRAAAMAERLGAAHIANSVLDPRACRDLEPALVEGTPLSGGLYMPQDEVGNCAYFARRMKEVCAGLGVRFVFGTAVQRMAWERSRIRALHLSNLEAGEETTLPVDAVVVAAGIGSARLLHPLRIRLPLFPVKGYSATAAVTRPECAPMHSIVDETYQVAVTRLGNRLRIAGTAEIGSRDLHLREAALGTLLRVARDWFPGAAVYNKAQFWVGARPMLPDGPPVLGSTPIPNLYLNVGHGSAGWSLACGSAAALAAILAGHAPEIDIEGLTLDRFMKWSQ
jgi:D-amino-acid dehydrogenase